MTKRARNAESGPDLDELLCFAVYTAGHAFSRVYKPLLEALGLTYPQYIVLVALWAEDDQTVGSLGDRMLLESNTLTPLLKRLEAMGYIARRRDATDERQVRVTLTEAGVALRAKAHAVPRCILEASGLSMGALERLRDDITNVRERLLAADPAVVGDSARAGARRRATSDGATGARRRRR